MPRVGIVGAGAGAAALSYVLNECGDEYETTETDDGVVTAVWRP